MFAFAFSIPVCLIPFFFLIINMGVHFLFISRRAYFCYFVGEGNGRHCRFVKSNVGKPRNGNQEVHI